MEVVSNLFENIWMFGLVLGEKAARVGYIAKKANYSDPNSTECGSAHAAWGIRDL